MLSHWVNIESMKKYKIIQRIQNQWTNIKLLNEYRIIE